MVDSPTEEIKDKIYNKYYRKNIKNEILKKEEVQQNLSDYKTRKREIHNLIFNKTLKDAVKNKRNPGNVRKYGVVKHGTNWFEEKIMNELNQAPTEENLRKQFPEKFDELKGKLKTFGLIREKEIKNFRNKGVDVSISEIRDKKGYYVTWKVNKKLPQK